MKKIDIGFWDKSGNYIEDIQEVDEREFMNEVIFEEFERLNLNYNLCLVGLQSILEYCKTIETSEEMITIANIIEKTLDSLHQVKIEVENNA